MRSPICSSSRRSFERVERGARRLALVLGPPRARSAGAAELVRKMHSARPRRWTSSWPGNISWNESSRRGGWGRRRRAASRARRTGRHQVPADEWLGDPEIVARFAREARTAIKIKSEHVARIIDVGILAGGAPYMVMEYFEGEDLATWLRARGPLPLDQASSSCCRRAKRSPKRTRSASCTAISNRPISS